MNAIVDNDATVYLEPPTIPAGITIDEYRRARAARGRPGLRGVLSAIRARR
jgi:hypothetical protein